MQKSKGTILIVDDNALNTELLVETLEPLEYKIKTYTNPCKALEDFKEEKVDLLLVDVVMPDIDGFSFVEKFLEIHPGTAVIFVSAHAANENKIRGYNLGSYTYIEKPFDVQTTRIQVQSVLNVKKMQDELLKEKEKLDNIFETSSNEIILTNLNFSVISRNYKILDKKTYEDKNFVEILQMHNQLDAIDLLKKYVKSNNKHTAFRFVIDNKRYTKANISKIITNSIHSGYMIVIEDKTDEIKRETQREHFIEMLTHDLKTPVRAEKRALKLLCDGSFGELNQSQLDILKEILNSSRYMMRMTDNILARYKIESSSYNIYKTSNSIKQTIQKCVNEINYMFEEANQVLKININLDEDVFDYDEKELQLVLSNLIVNASEYSPNNAEIRVSVTTSGGKVIIKVSDNGPGIENEKLETIFSDVHTKDIRFKKVGAGMGLFIAKKIIEAHGGDIELKTQKGLGCEFTVTLPYVNSKITKLVKN